VKARADWRGSEVKWNWSLGRWWKLSLRNTSRQPTGRAFWVIVSFSFNLGERDGGKRKIDSSDLKNRFVASLLAPGGRACAVKSCRGVAPVTGQWNIPLNKLLRPAVGRRQDENRARWFSIESEMIYDRQCALFRSRFAKNLSEVRIQRTYRISGREPTRGRPVDVSGRRTRNDKYHQGRIWFWQHILTCAPKNPDHLFPGITTLRSMADVLRDHDGKTCHLSFSWNIVSNRLVSIFYG